jgi:predicted ABC-type ATPase
MRINLPVADYPSLVWPSERGPGGFGFKAKGVNYVHECQLARFCATIGGRCESEGCRGPAPVRGAAGTKGRLAESFRSHRVRSVNRPIMTVIAGANGAGKSTLTSGNPATFASIPVLDPDAFAKTIPSSGKGLSPIAAGREVLRSTGQHLKRRESFAVETTLSGKNYLRMMRYARGIGRGFEVILIYIGTESVEINLARIAERVRTGGHDVPEIDVRRRYFRSLENLPIAVKSADHVLLFDNSKEQGYQLAGILARSKSEWFSPLPSWAAELRAKLSRA